MSRSSLIALALASSLAVGGALAAPAGCASYPSAAVVKCVKDTPKAQKKKAQKKPRVNLDVDHPVREPDLPKKKASR